MGGPGVIFFPSLARASPSPPKVRNDAASDGLDLARRRIKKLEDAREAAEAKLELSQVSLEGGG